ncbi:MAG: hypothetical protein WBM90_12075 [Acidimicrobiia bacterium]
MGDLREKSGDRDWLEPVAAVIMSIATVFIAWSSFQNTAWAGEVADLGRQAGAARTESAKDLARLNQDLIGDQVLFSSYVLALSSGDDKAIGAVAAEFRPDFAPLVAEWERGGPNAPSPFDSDKYAVQEQIAATTEHTLKAEDAGAAATSATERRNEYAAATVLLALVLFNVGIGMTFKKSAIRQASLISGGLILVVAASWVLSLPKVL